MLSGLLAACPPPVQGQIAPALAPEPIRSIGALAGDPKKEFGHIVGLAVDESRGVLFVLDRLTHSLSAFSREGELLARRGGQGGGPGEFRVPRAVAAGDGDSAVYTYDNGTLRISKYRFEADSLALVDEVRSPLVNVWDICALDGDLFFLRYHDGHLIHRLTPAGKVTRSFGALFRDDPELQRMAQTLDNGHIACDATNRSVYVSAYITPTVRRYSASGELLWEAQVPGMVPTLVERTERGSVRFTNPRGRQATVAPSLTTIPGGRLLVQFGDPVRGTSEDIVDVTSVVFDVEDGSVLMRRDDLPRIDVATENFAYSHASVPFPRIVVYEWRRP